MDKKLVLVIFVLVAILIVAGSFYIKSQKQTAPKSTGSAEQVKKVDPKTSVSNNIKSTFSGSSNKNVSTFVNLASGEKDVDKSYQYYLKAYAQMNKSYLQTKDPKIAVSMIRLASYLSTLPQYKEGEVTLPQ